MPHSPCQNPLNIASLEDRNKPSKVGYENFTRIYPTEAKFRKSTKLFNIFRSKVPPTCWLTVGPLTVDSPVTEEIPADTASSLTTLDVLAVTGAAPLLNTPNLTILPVLVIF